MMRAVGQRDISIQEVMHQILSIKLVSSSFQVITASFDGSRKVFLSENESYIRDSEFIARFVCEKKNI